MKSKNLDIGRLVIEVMWSDDPPFIIKNKSVTHEVIFHIHRISGEGVKNKAWQIVFMRAGIMFGWRDK